LEAPYGRKNQKRYFEKAKEEPFAEKFGLQFIDVQDGYAKVTMTFTPDMENMFGMAHGGAIFSLIDAAFEIASNSHGTMAVALNMNINYLASPQKGALLTAEAKEINRTKNRRLRYSRNRRFRKTARFLPGAGLPAGKAAAVLMRLVDNETQTSET